MKNKLVIGSRESRLAVIQSEMVMNFIKERCPDMDVSLSDHENHRRQNFG